MAQLLATNGYIIFIATKNANGLTVRSVGNIENTSVQALTDSNMSGKLDAGDHWSIFDYPIQPWMVEIDGRNYAIFEDMDVRDHFVIPFSTSDPFSQDDANAALTDAVIDTPVVYDNVANCFAAGTLIETARGEVAVEDLAIGDRVRTLSDGLVPVKWIGRQRAPGGTARLFARQPVVVERGALAAGLVPAPHTDLYVTEDHAILIDGVLVQAGALVGDRGIRRASFAEMPAEFSWYHVETERHEVILANGAPAESFIDNLPRDLFDNHAEYLALYGHDTPEMAELPYPRAMSRRQLASRLRV